MLLYNLRRNCILIFFSTPSCLDSMFLPEKPYCCQKLFQTICCYIRDGVCMSIENDENSRRILCCLISLATQSITEVSNVIC